MQGMQDAFHMEYSLVHITSDNQQLRHPAAAGSMWSSQSQRTSYSGYSMSRRSAQGRHPKLADRRYLHATDCNLSVNNDRPALAADPLRLGSSHIGAQLHT